MSGREQKQQLYYAKATELTKLLRIGPSGELGLEHVREQACDV